MICLCTLGNSASAADFIATRPTPRVEYWQNRYVQIDEALADVNSLPAVKLLFVGDSITDFWLLDDNPWMPDKKCGRQVWDESFQQPGSENLALNIGVSGDRTEHLLYRLLPKAQGGMGQVDSPQLAPEFIVLMIGINNSWAAEEPAADSMFEGARAVILALHERKPGVPIILQSLLPIVDEPKDAQLVQPVNERLRALAESKEFAGYVSYLDLYPSFVDGSGKQISRYFNDGIHPSLEGYRVWRDRLVPFLAQARASKKP
ncbi:MAG: GDSL-type esterase/lipase family protein [Gammaproteobacteria bacterium]|nr:GDSL-type esterase/lipase family protein [Gammaproteobacteria bacterium]